MLLLMTTIFGARNDSPLFIENQLAFYENIFIPEIKKRGVDTVLMLGDTWDRRKYVNLNTLHVFKQRFFKPLYDMGVKIKMIYGNHDVYYRNTNDVNSVDFLEKEFPNIEVISSSKIFDFDGTKIGLISWIHSGNLEEGLNFIKTADCDVLAGHFEIKTFEMVRGSYCDSGFDKRIFDRFEKVISGHFHVISDDGRIHYLGNAHQLNWSDYGLRKGFWFLDTNTRELELVENPHSLYEKIYFKEDIDLIKFDYEQYSSKIVRVFVKNFEIQNKKKLDLFVDRLTARAFSVEVHEISTVDQEEESDNAEINIDSSDTMGIIDQYIDGVTAGSTFDKTILRKHLADIYTEALDRVVSA